MYEYLIQEATMECWSDTLLSLFIYASLFVLTQGQ